MFISHSKFELGEDIYLDQRNVRAYKLSLLTHHGPVWRHLQHSAMDASRLKSHVAYVSTFKMGIKTDIGKREVIQSVVGFFHARVPLADPDNRFNYLVRLKEYLGHLRQLLP